MEIGLVTYHHSNNVGAILQTYATCRALQELGHQVVIVDIRQTEDKRNGLGRIASDLLFYRRDHKYQQFMKHFYPPLTRRYFTIEDLRRCPPNVDCLVVGSDQTWNPYISKDVAMAYFLDFGRKEARRFSYASSFGISKWPDNYSLTDNVKRALNHFDNISVREKTGIDILNNEFKKEGVLVVDPTMLFDSYPEITDNIKQRNEVVCYKLNRNSDFFDNIGKVKKEMQIPIRLLNNIYPIKGLRYTYPPSVTKWIELMGGAKFVITDSFHGTVFSLLYKREFAVIKGHNSRDSRYIDLLKSLGLESRLFDSVEQLSNNIRCLEPLDYVPIINKINAYRVLSWEYLKMALS